jgi:hypothetical protein
MGRCGWFSLAVLGGGRGLVNSEQQQPAMLRAAEIAENMLKQVI